MSFELNPTKLIKTDPLPEGSACPAPLPVILNTNAVFQREIKQDIASSETVGASSSKDLSIANHVVLLDTPPLLIIDDVIPSCPDIDASKAGLAAPCILSLPKKPQHNRQQRSSEDCAFIREICRTSKDIIREEIRKKIQSPKCCAWSYHHFPEGVKAEEEEKKMEVFINGSDFDKFYEELTEVLAVMTEDDVHSIGSDETTPIALKFIALFDSLQQYGFHGFKDHKRCFWSGSEAKYHAFSLAPDILTDSQVPSVTIGFDIAKALQLTEQKNASGRTILYNLLPPAISALFAEPARGEVSVYISTDSPQCETPCLQVGNNFWICELPILRQLQFSGKIKKILVYSFKADRDYKLDINRYDNIADRPIPKGHWGQPIDLCNSSCSCKLILLRRKLHPGTVGGTKDNEGAFCPPQSLSNDEYLSWAVSKTVARPTLRMSKLHELANRWRRNAHQKRLDREKKQ